MSDASKKKKNQDMDLPTYLAYMTIIYKSLYSPYSGKKPELLPDIVIEQIVNNLINKNK